MLASSESSGLYLGVLRCAVCFFRLRRGGCLGLLIALLRLCNLVLWHKPWSRATFIVHGASESLCADKTLAANSAVAETLTGLRCSAVCNPRMSIELDDWVCSSRCSVCSMSPWGTSRCIKHFSRAHGKQRRPGADMQYQAMQLQTLTWVCGSATPASAASVSAMPSASGCSTCSCAAAACDTS